jgi:peptidoglycan/LPS O-acetylase OafA/YrhL
MKPARLAQLDSLRAFAVLAVMVHHFVPVAKVIPEDFLTLGLLGVRFFFTLSGFLITSILLRDQAVGTFYLRRSIRIFPAYFLCIFILLMLGAADLRQNYLWHTFYVSNILFAFHGFTGAAHFWSLSVEEQFYLVWPWLMIKIPSRHSWKLAVAAIFFTLIYKSIIAFTLGPHLVGGLLPFACFDSLGLGALLACFRYDANLKPYRNLFLKTAVSLGSFIVGTQVIIYLCNRGTRIFWATSYLGVSLIFTWLVAKAAEGKLWKLIEARPLTYTGRISYGLYLWHIFMPALVIWLLGYNPGTWKLAALATLLTFAVAAASWKLVESPLNSLKRKIGVRNRVTQYEEAIENAAGGI